jgi:hypothetical protein
MNAQMLAILFLVCFATVGAFAVLTGRGFRSEATLPWRVAASILIASAPFCINAFGVFIVVFDKGGLPVPRALWLLFVAPMVAALAILGLCICWNRLCCAVWKLAARVVHMVRRKEKSNHKPSKTLTTDEAESDG